MSSEIDPLPPLEPHLTLPSPNDPIQLWSGLATTDWGQGEKQCETTLCYSWPNQSLMFETEYPSRQTMVMCSRHFATTENLEFDGAWLKSQGTQSGKRIAGFAWNVNRSDKEFAQLDHVQFLIANSHSELCC